LPGEGANQEVRNPALIFGAKLPRTVNATHSEHRGGQAIGPCILQHVLVRRTLGTSIGTLKIELLRLVDAMLGDPKMVRHVPCADLHRPDARQLSIYLIGRQMKQGRRSRHGAKHLQQGQRAAYVYRKVEHRIDQAGGYCHLCGKVKDSAHRHAVPQALRLIQGRPQRPGIAYVSAYHS
jgi:hypothetical protein